MALIACSDCGKEVSDAAPACIHCGRPLGHVMAAAAPGAAPSQAVKEGVQRAKLRSDIGQAVALGGILIGVVAGVGSGSFGVFALLAVIGIAAGAWLYYGW